MNSTIFSPLNSTNYTVLYPQNGDSIVAIDYMTSLHAMYRQSCRSVANRIHVDCKQPFDQEVNNDSQYSCSRLGETRAFQFAIRIDSIRFDSLCESIRIDSFCKKSAFRFTSCHAVFLAYLLYYFQLSFTV